MRKFALLALASAVTLAWGTAQAYTPGIYKASAPGMGGPVEVTVEFSKDAITLQVVKRSLKAQKRSRHFS